MLVKRERGEKQIPEVKLSWAHTVTLTNTDINFMVTHFVAIRHEAP